jgi:hypothetical protein
MSEKQIIKLDSDHERQGLIAFVKPFVYNSLSVDEITVLEKGLKALSISFEEFIFQGEGVYVKVNEEPYLDIANVTNRPIIKEVYRQIGDESKSELLKEEFNNSMIEFSCITFQVQYLLTEYFIVQNQLGIAYKLNLVILTSLDQIKERFLSELPEKLAPYIVRLNKQNERIGNLLKLNQLEGKENAKKGIITIINGGENEKVEFKSSLKFDVSQKGIPPKIIEHTCLKTLAAFLNSDGGTLYIGIKDDGNILGLEQTDFTTFSKPNKEDEWKKHFDNLIGNALGNATHALVKTQLVLIENKSIAVVAVNKSIDPIWMKNEKGVEEVYVRRTASTIGLQGNEAVQYINQHWKK